MIALICIACGEYRQDCGHGLCAVCTDAFHPENEADLTCSDSCARVLLARTGGAA